MAGFLAGLSPQVLLGILGALSAAGTASQGQAGGSQRGISAQGAVRPAFSDPRLQSRADLGSMIGGQLLSPILQGLISPLRGLSVGLGGALGGNTQPLQDLFGGRDPQFAELLRNLPSGTFRGI